MFSLYKVISMQKKRIYLSKENSVISGVCGGIGEYFDIDPTVVRLFWILFSIFGGAGIIGYIIAMVIIPENPHSTCEEYDTSYKSNETYKNYSNKGNIIVGGALIAIGSVYLLQRVFGLYWLRMSQLWPLVLVFFGLFIIFKGRE
ncbi:PspC domain-containing protein [Serpentinicella alkaliphila]|nr:PspC domain-containing protein [Serpentinicella alkaliphila]QUH24405.1 PspC domain-containing protein [Serpentinicella alkaliphila]